MPRKNTYIRSLVNVSALLSGGTDDKFIEIMFDPSNTEQRSKIEGYMFAERPNSVMTIFEKSTYGEHKGLAIFDETNSNARAVDYVGWAYNTQIDDELAPLNYAKLRITNDPLLGTDNHSLICKWASKTFQIRIFEYVETGEWFFLAFSFSNSDIPKSHMFNKPRALKTTETKEVPVIETTEEVLNDVSVETEEPVETENTDDETVSEDVKEEVTKDNIIADIINVANGEPINRDTYRKLGKFSDWDIKQKFDSFTDLKKSAGVK